MTSTLRIIVVGQSIKAGLRNSLVAGFRHLGSTVDLLDLPACSPPWLKSVAFRCPSLGFNFRRDFDRLIESRADKGQVDVILVLKGELLNAKSIDHLRARLNGPVVCWNPDSPFDDAISNRGAGIPRTIAAYDAYVTWADDVADRLSAINRSVFVIPFAWDPEIMQPTTGRGVAAGRIVFIGTGTKKRSAYLRSLAHLRPMVFGSRWPKMAGVDVLPPVHGVEFCQIATEAKWNLNLLRPQNSRSHNMRTFELVGAGGSQVAPDTNDHRRLLHEDNRTVLFRSREELESVLRSNPEELLPRLPTVLDGHTYADRAQQLLSALRIS